MKTITYDDTQWQLVPKELIEEMNIAAIKVLHRAHGIDGLPQRMLDAMLSAAPTPPAQPAERKPLTQDQIDSACMGIFGSDHGGVLTLSLQRAVARATEAAHGIIEPKP